MWLRHLLAIAILPFTATVLIPLWIARRYHVDVALADSVRGLAPQMAGVLLMAAGLILFATTVHEFATRGKGTLAPWDAPRKLVVDGAYRYVRNPMISGVVLILFGEALGLWSAPHFAWAVLFLFINAIYIPLLEEPLLRQRFGDAYIDYCRHVPRILPRLKPWIPGP